jgi:hypothetical protein
MRMGERAPETGAPLRKGPDPLESAGQSVLGLLERAAGMAEKNIQHAVGVAQKLSQEIKTAEQQIRELEEDVRYYKDKASRAERWLRDISSEIEQRFFGAAKTPAEQAQSWQSDPEDYAPPRDQQASRPY